MKEKDIAEELLRRARIVFDVMLNGLTQEPDRKAIFFTVQRKGSVPHKTRIGTTFPDKEFEEKCCFFSEEKISRMFSNDHISSWKSRDPDKNMWGGAVKLEIDCETWGISASGFKEFEDEALSLVVGYGLGDTLSEEESCIRHLRNLNEIFETGGNEKYATQINRIARYKMGGSKIIEIGDEDSKSEKDMGLCSHDCDPAVGCDECSCQGGHE